MPHVKHASFFFATVISVLLLGCTSDPEGPNIDDPSTLDPAAPPVEFTNCLSDTVIHPQASLTLHWQSRHPEPPDSVFIEVQKDNEQTWIPVYSGPFSAGKHTLPPEQLPSRLIRFRIHNGQYDKTSHTENIIRYDTDQTSDTLDTLGFILLQPSDQDTVVWQNGRLTWIASQAAIREAKLLEINFRFHNQANWSSPGTIPVNASGRLLWELLPDLKGGYWDIRMRLAGTEAWTAQVHIFIADFRFTKPSVRGAILNCGRAEQYLADYGAFSSFENDMEIDGSSDGGQSWIPFPSFPPKSPGGYLWKQRLPFPLQATEEGLLRLTLRRGSSVFHAFSEPFVVQGTSTMMWSLAVGDTMLFRHRTYNWQRYSHNHESFDTLRVTVTDRFYDAESQRMVYPLSIYSYGNGETTYNEFREEMFGMHRITGWALDKRIGPNVLLAFTSWESGQRTFTTENSFSYAGPDFTAGVTMEKDRGLVRIVTLVSQPKEYKESYEWDRLD